MDVDVVLLIVLIVAGIFFFRKFKSSIYFIASLDIFFRILTFVKNNIGVKEISNFVSKYFPESIPGVINKYTNGIVATILMWVYVAVFAIFLFYTVKILWKKK